MYLKACANYGLKEQDLFQVNDLYENKNLYMVVDNIYNLGGMVSKDDSKTSDFINLCCRPRKKAGMDQFWV